MKERVLQRAREVGFDACGITTAQPPETGKHFQRWLDAGHHGEMSWLERNAPKRVDPGQVLADCRSIVCVTASYHTDAFRRSMAVPATAEPRHPPPPQHFHEPLSHSTSAPPPSSPRGVIARYACYSDYHDVLGKNLRSLCAFLDELGGTGTRSLWYVDTGPILERDLAQRAGIGFIGKHTNLISRAQGNWIFLGEILTTLALEPDVPESNRCGKCTRCLTACPTQAIVAPFQLDARRCISYLTIELKGSIPVELRPAIGNRIYGCDDCLAVCPWNRFAQEGALLRPHARADLAAPDLLELLALDDAGFKRRFTGTPILRTKRRGLLRNVCVALGNVGDEQSLPALERAAHDHEPLVAEHARWAVDQINARLKSQNNP